MNTIFISYRRADASAWAMWLESVLHERYGEHSVFRDLTSLRVGDRFEEEIHRVLSSCKAAIVMIGPNWLSLQGDTGVSRLFEPNDFVRREIERALDRHDVMVIPVLVEGMRMPEAHELPGGLQRLAGYQALDLSDARRKQDVGILYEALERAGMEPLPKPGTARGEATLPSPSPSPSPAPSYMPALAALAMTAAAAIGALIATSPAKEIGKRESGDELPTRLAAYAGERSVLWAVIGALALVVAYLVLARDGWGQRTAGAIGTGLRGLVVCAFAGAAGGALLIVLQDERVMSGLGRSCAAATLTGLILAGAFAKLSSESGRSYYLAAGLVAGLLVGAVNNAAAGEGALTAGDHALEAMLMVGIFGLTLAGLAMAPSDTRVHTTTRA